MNKWHLSSRPSVIVLIGLLLAPAAAEADERAADAEPSEVVLTLVQDLGAREFGTRVTASERLSEFPVRDVAAIADLADGQVNAEGLVRLLHELEVRYTSGNEQDVAVISDVLETLQSSRRLVLADGSQQILREHWRVRVDIAKQALVQLGAKFREGSFVSPDDMRWLPGRGAPTVQILLGEEWRGGESGLRLLDRLAVLTELRFRGSGLFVWLLEGHPLTDREIALLAEIVDRSRINERSRVALGITGDRGIGRGVLIRAITRASSAADAGLEAGDILLAIPATIPADLSEAEQEELRKQQELQDFDDLVERLKGYREGDVMSLSVFRRRTSTVEIVDVKLKGWDKLPVQQN